jgi:hypothetical protein
VDFADWYRVVAIEPRPELLEKRRRAMEDVVPGLDLAGVLELVRLLYDAPARDPQFIERYREAFRAIDATFPMRDNEAELGILAAATIVSVLEHRGGAVADLAAQATVCADCQGHRPGERPPGVVPRAREYLSARAAALRVAPDLTGVAKPVLDTEALLARMERLLDLPAPAGRGRAASESGIGAVLEGSYGLGSPSLPRDAPAADAGGLALQSVVAAVLDVAAATAKVAEEHARRLRLHGEQLDVLWWLVAEYSRDLRQEVRVVPLPVLCVVAGKELADLTAVLPGPPGAAGALDRILRAAEPELRSSTTISEAVSGIPRAWRTGWAAGDRPQPLEHLCPVIMAVRRSLEADGGDEWTAAVWEATGVDVAEDIHPLDLAMQAYEEALLLRFFAPGR